MTGVRVEEGRGARPGGSGRAPPGNGGALRVLISFSPGYAAYGATIARGLRVSRPHLRTRLAPLRNAGGASRRFGPHLVISDGAVRAPGAAKARISAEPREPSTMRVGGMVRTVVNPSFDDLLRFVDEVERYTAG